MSLEQNDFPFSCKNPSILKAFKAQGALRGTPVWVAFCCVHCQSERHAPTQYTGLLEWSSVLSVHNQTALRWSLVSCVAYSCICTTLHNALGGGVRCAAPSGDLLRWHLQVKLPGTGMESQAWTGSYCDRKALLASLKVVHYVWGLVSSHKPRPRKGWETGPALERVWVPAAKGLLLARMADVRFGSMRTHHKDSWVYTCQYTSKHTNEHTQARVYKHSNTTQCTHLQAHSTVYRLKQHRCSHSRPRNQVPAQVPKTGLKVNCPLGGTTVSMVPVSDAL